MRRRRSISVKQRTNASIALKGWRKVVDWSSYSRRRRRRTRTSRCWGRLLSLLYFWIKLSLANQSCSTSPRAWSRRAWDMLDTIWQCRTQWQVESPKSEPTWMRRQKLVKWATRTFPSVAPRSRVWWSSCWTRWNELNRNQTTSPINRSGIRVAVVAWTRARLIWWMSWSNSFVSPIPSKLQILSKTETNKAKKTRVICSAKITSILTGEKRKILVFLFLFKATHSHE